MKLLTRALCALILCLGFGCGSLPTSQPVSPPQGANVADLQSKTVALVEQDGTSVDAFCSGVWVSGHVILTANHCMRGSEVGEKVGFVVRPDVYFSDSVEENSVIVARDAVIMAEDEPHDLALLHVTFPPDHGVAKLSLTGVQSGQRVLTMGAPLGNMFSYSSGEVAAIRYVESHGHKILFVQATAPISGGNSGGGLFNEWGELVGTCHATFSKGQNMNLWVHYTYAEQLLRSRGL